MDSIKNFYAILSGASGTIWQRILCYLCLAAVLALLIFILVVIRKARKRKAASASATEGEEEKYPVTRGGYVWKDRRRIFLGLPWTFDRYRLTKEKLLLVTGFLNIKEEEVKLYRVLDLSLTKTFGQRLFRLGTITIKSNDKSLPLVVLKNVKRPNKVKELISELVEKERLAKRVGSSEMMGLQGHPVDADGDGMPDMPEHIGMPSDIHPGL